jgi:arabinose-5-phosphate isomerase
MRRLGIDAHIDTSGSASSVARVYVDPRGARAIYMTRGATGELTAAEIGTRHRGVIERAHVVTTEISQLPLAVVRRVLGLARASGARTVLDVDVPLGDSVPALGSEEDLLAALSLADVLKPSKGALDGLVEGRGAEELARAVAQKFGAEVVAVTDGASGCALAVGPRTLRVPAPLVRAIDSTGAGDAFLGGLLAGLRRGLDWEDVARLANACGAACCEQLGAFPERPEELRARVLELFAGLGGPRLDWPPLQAPALQLPEVEEFLEAAPHELQRLAGRLDRQAIARVAQLVRDAEAEGGRVHVTGIGKSEHVARYVAGLLSSTGTPATFLHGTEVLHGSVGQLRPGDVVIAISNSGTTAELLAGVDATQAFGARLVAVTADTASPLAQRAEVTLEVGVEREGDPLELAPRASVLAQTLALQALSVELQVGRGFTRQDYHRRHRGGALGLRSAD